MTAPPRDLAEALPEHEAPDVMPLPPPADSPAPRKRSGSTKRQRAGMAFIRLSEAERAELERRAKLAGLSIGSYCRQQALGTPGPRPRRATPTPDIELLARTYADLNRIGNNLNQIARALNEIALIGDTERLGWETTDLTENIREIQADLALTLFTIRQALGYDR